MGHRIVGQQLAPYVAEHGGASVHFNSGRHVEGPGFMVSELESEKRVGGDPTAEQIQDYADSRYPANKTPHPDAALGVWDGVLDESKKISTLPEARRVGSKHLQEAAYALPKTPVGGQGTPERLGREYGADVLLNLGKSQSAGGSTFLDLHENEAETINQTLPRHSARQILHGRAMTEVAGVQRRGEESAAAPDMVPDPRHASLNEVDNDSWSMTSRANVRSTVGKDKARFRVPREERRRETLGDVLRTINRGRMYAARGSEMTVDKEKGWHPTDAKPSKIKSNPDDGERTPVTYTPELEAERPRQFR